MHAPIGLDIGAVTPQEIAVSILAELIAVKHGKIRGSDAAASMKWEPPKLVATQGMNHEAHEDHEARKRLRGTSWSS